MCGAGVGLVWGLFGAGVGFHRRRHTVFFNSTQTGFRLQFLLAAMPSNNQERREVCCV